MVQLIASYYLGMHILHKHPLTLFLDGLMKKIHQWRGEEREEFREGSQDWKWGQRQEMERGGESWALRQQAMANGLELAKLVRWRHGRIKQWACCTLCCVSKPLYRYYSAIKPVFFKYLQIGLCQFENWHRIILQKWTKYRCTRHRISYLSSAQRIV